MAAKSEESDEENEEDGPKPIRSWQKLLLLFWKNWIIQWNQKLQLLVAIALPIFFLMIVVILRLIVKPELKDVTVYPPVAINNLQIYKLSLLQGGRIFHVNGTANIPKHVLCYAPNNNITTAIIEASVKRLELLGTRSFNTELEMEKDMVEHNFLAGVTFHDMHKSNKGYPKYLNITLKFPSELRTMPGLIIETWHTDRLFQRFTKSGPRNYNMTDGGVPVGYVREAFIPIQHAIVMSWLELATGRKKFPDVQLQRFPYVPYILDPLLNGLQQLLPFIILIGFIYPSTFIAKNVTNEKELQLKEIMKLMGIHSWLHWTAWYVKSYILLMVIVTISMFLLLIKFDGNVAILTYTNWLPLLIFFHFYVASSICFCFMIGVFFSKASTSAAVTGILWFLTFIPYSFAFYYYERLNLATKLILSLVFQNTALGFGFHVIMAREGTGEGLQFSNMMKAVSEDDSLALYQVILAMCISGIVYMIICLYVEQIFPGPYGAARPWNFPFKSKFWRDLCKCGRSFMPIGDLPLFGGHKVHPDCNSRNNVGIELRDLEKTYGQHKAVKNLNLKLYRNEITVLLGHNGAGKSTTLNMLTGIIPPTSGTALINGKDICTEVDAARRSLGICPQHDVLFSDMTVRQHIVFFSRLKGVRRNDVEKEVQKYMQIMELEHKSKVTAKNLSGGMKRKLSLCIALCGNTRAVLCDEPSSGIDAAGRRRLWDLLLAEKFGRTILLTTHYMDEANVLGDRIAILSNGELQCYGTPFDLKKRYGLGYRLVCVTEDGCDVKALTELMSKHIPNIQPESAIGSEIIYRLPSEYTSKYAALLNDLDRGSQELKLDGYGISVATIEDVFVKMNVETGAKFQSGGSVLNSIVQLAKNTLMNTLNVKKEEQRQFRNLSIFDLKLPDRSFCSRFLMHCEALIYKNVWVTLRNYWILIAQILIPIVFTSLNILNSRGGRIYYHLPEILISPLQYRESFAVLESRVSNSPLSIAYARYVGSFGNRFTLIKTEMPFEDFILETAKGHRQTIDAQYVAGVTIDSDLLTVWLNNQPLHTAPLTLNILHNALARRYLGENAGTAVANGPLPYSDDTLPMRLNKGQKLGAEIALNVSLTMSFITSFFVLSVIKERASRAKLLQYLTGLNIFSYWFSQLIWDYIIFIFISILYIVTIAAFQELGYSHFSDLMRYFALLLIFGIPGLLLSYVMSYFFTDGATGLTRTAIITALTGTAFFLLILSLQFEDFQLGETADKLTWYFRIFPHFCLANGLHNIHINFNIRRGCSFAGLKKLSKYDICVRVPTCCDIPGYFAWRKHGVLPEVVFLLIVAICLFLILIAIDAKFVSNSFAFLKNKWKSNRSEGGAGSRSSDPQNKDGIRAEIERIQNFTDEEFNQMPLIVDSISKHYGKLIAVNNLSFFVDHGECFGLLGINGAGKTTTFKMLTGDSKITSGSAYVVGLDLNTQMRKVFPKIGYCPQFNALFEELTGRETLRIFCLLRCIQRHRIKRICNDLANFFGFQPHVDKRVKHYSGGNKRKLSVAIAFIGNPMVLYLDEPTCGMDPAAQRQLWQILATIRSHGKSSVLTTHSMEECEALCTRIAIMISGQLKCIGSIQQIKNNYSKGLILKIRLKVAPKKLERSVVSSESSDISSDNISGTQSKYNSSSHYTTNVGTNTETNPETDKEKIERKDRKRRPSKELPNEDIEPINTDTKRLQRIKDFIAKKVPDAVLREEVNELLTYLLPTDSIAWSEIFQLMENNRDRLHIEDYVITQTRLEEIFLNFVWDDMNQSQV